MSGHEGADVPDTDRSVALDAARLLAELRRTLGMPTASSHEYGDDDEDGGDDDSSEGSSFFSGSGGEEEEEEEDVAMDGPVSSFAKELERQMGGGADCPKFHSQRPAASAAPPDTAAFHEQQVLWEAETATDSDDDAESEHQEDDEEEKEEEEDALTHPGISGPESRRGFFGMYSRAMEEQLGGTSMAESFDRGEPVAAAATAAGGDGQRDGHAGDGELLRPVDLDMNLVKSLLRSVAAQQGLSGPAGNLAGLLGMELPQGMEEGDVSGGIDRD